MPRKCKEFKKGRRFGVPSAFAPSAYRQPRQQLYLKAVKFPLQKKFAPFFCVYAQKKRLSPLLFYHLCQYWSDFLCLYQSLTFVCSRLLSFLFCIFLLINKVLKFFFDFVAFFLHIRNNIICF